tara:strand:- start:123 stop:440 length:318 start_codon:yes stop_codon:yes gene_type:complete
MKGKWSNIKEEVMEEIDATGFQQKWVQDPSGYFLIRIKDEMIEVGHCTNDHKLVKVIRGKTPEEIVYKIIDLNLISSMDHAAYLGKELQKAALSIKLGFDYVQDS